MLPNMVGSIGHWLKNTMGDGMVILEETGLVRMKGSDKRAAQGVTVRNVGSLAT
jgi:hypothetical protein